MTDKKLCSKSFCIVSEDLLHDVAFVLEVQGYVIGWIKEHLKHIKTITYFSDGCAQQYKNYKNFINLSYHETDFNISAKWAFFATSHGKSPCDGIGGTVKRLVKRACLQKRAVILNIVDFMHYCQYRIEGIAFMHLSSNTLQSTRTFLKKRFESGNTVPGTPSYHLFVLLGNGQIAFKNVASDEKYAGQIKFFSPIPETIRVEPMEFVACIYNAQWWIGIVLSINHAYEDVEVKFMKPAGPSTSFAWPAFDDICNIPYNDVICKVSCPQILGSGRRYTIDSSVMAEVDAKFRMLALLSE